MTDADAAKAGLLDHICHDEGSACPSCADFRAAIAAIEALQAECLEQARLNGMGAEREAALMAKVKALQAENEKLLDSMKDIHALGHPFPGRDVMSISAVRGLYDRISGIAAATLTTQEKPMTDLKTDWERRADIEAEERRMKQIKEADAGKKP